MSDISPQYQNTNLFTRLYSSSIEFAFFICQSIPQIFAVVVVVWCVRVRDAGLGRKMAILDEDVELRPAAKPVFVKAWPKLRLVFLRGVFDEDGEVTTQEFELFARSPVWRSHVEENKME